MFVGSTRQPRFSLGDILVVVAGVACFLDAFTTWIALHQPGFAEHTPAVSSLIGTLGLTNGLAISVLLRIVLFALVGIAMQRLPKISLPLFAIGATGVAMTLLLVLSNISALATN